MSIDYYVAWLMVFLRSLGIILQLPVLAGRSLPVILRVGLCMCLATLLAGIVPSGHVPETLGSLGASAAAEVMLGLLMGFMTRLTFDAVEMAGRVISQEIGLSGQAGLGIPQPATEPVASLFSAFSIIGFFLVRGHEMLLSAFARSFRMLPAGHVAFGAFNPGILIEATGHVIDLGVRIAAPFIAMNFLVTLAFSVLGRAVPRMNVFAMAFGMRILAGFTLLGAAGGLLMRYLYTEFAAAPIRMLQVLPPH